MIYVFDLDGTLCDTTGGLYNDSQPMEARIERVRGLEDEGHRIIVSTARGPRWEDLTRRQLLEWGVPFHTLYVGTKPYADFYIDDKAINVEEFFL